MSKLFFTADWHLGDDRIGINGKPNLFYRPFKSVDEQNERIFAEFINSEFEDGDTLWHLGDVVYSDEPSSWDILKTLKYVYPNSKFNLIVGNYDEDKIPTLKKYFNIICDSIDLQIQDKLVTLNHYPIKCINQLNGCHFGITGHIHGLWKVQRDLINVGVDAWHFKPVSIDEIEFCFNAMTNHYDNNVFPYNY